MRTLADKKVENKVEKKNNNNNSTKQSKNNMFPNFVWGTLLINPSIFWFFDCTCIWYTVRRFLYCKALPVSRLTATC